MIMTRTPIQVRLAETKKEKPDAETLVFGRTFTDHMFVADFEEGKGFKASVEDSAVSIGIRKNRDLTKQINTILEKISEEERQEIMIVGS